MNTLLYTFRDNLLKVVCNNSRIPTIFLLSSAFALIFAYVLEYFFNMLPCKLCTYEQVVYYVAGLLAVVCMLKDNKILIYAMFCSYLIGAVISFYHVGLELHLFHDILGCTEQASGNVSIEELRNNLLNPNYSPSCDRPHYVLGVSLATWNLIYLIVALFVSGKVYCGERNLNNLRYSNNRFLQQAIRVNHAGEYGAICIYSGQKFILKKSSIINEIIEMEEQEKKHFHYFNEKIKKQKVRPTVLLPVWRVLGVSLGVATAIMGKKAAMACTAAVEEVIGEHYKEQVSHLEDGELRETISKFRDEELEHRDIAIQHNAESAFGYNILSSFIKTGCKAAICLSKLI